MTGRICASLLAAGAVILCTVPAAASTLPPLDLDRGQGTVGGGITIISGDVAIADGLSLGVSGFSGLFATGALGRGTLTLRRGDLGALGLMATAGPLQSLYGSDRQFAALLGPVYESPPWFVRVRAALLPGLLVSHRANYSPYVSDASEGQIPDPVLLSEDTVYSLGWWPMLEVVVPLGKHFELAVGGNQLVGVFGRW